MLANNSCLFFPNFPINLRVRFNEKFPMIVLSAAGKYFTKTVLPSPAQSYGHPLRHSILQTMGEILDASKKNKSILYTNRPRNFVICFPLSREVQSPWERGRLVRPWVRRRPACPGKHGIFADATSANPGAGETPALHKLAPL